RASSRMVWARASPDRYPVARWMATASAASSTAPDGSPRDRRSADRTRSPSPSRILYPYRRASATASPTTTSARSRRPGPVADRAVQVECGGQVFAAVREPAGQPGHVAEVGQGERLSRAGADLAVQLAGRPEVLGGLGQPALFLRHHAEVDQVARLAADPA